MFANHFSDICFLLQGNNVQTQSFPIVFLFHKVSKKKRIMCKNCVADYGGNVGEPLEIGDIPFYNRQNGEFYMLSVGYPQMQEALRGVHFYNKLEYYIAEIDDLTIDDNKQVVVKNPIRLVPRYDAVTSRKISDSLLTKPETLESPLSFSKLFECEIVHENLVLNYKTIVHLGDYTRFAKNKKLFDTALRLGISKRIIFVDIDVARQATRFPLEDDMKLATLIAPEYSPPFFNGTNLGEAVNFLTKHQKVIMSLEDTEGNPQFLTFDLSTVAKADRNEFFDEFLTCYKGEHGDSNARNICLYKYVPATPTMPSCRAVVFDHKILPMGVQRILHSDYPHLNAQPFYLGVFPVMHDELALEPLRIIAERLTKTFPYRYFGIDYRIVSENQKRYFVLTAVTVLKSKDLGLIIYHTNKNRSQIEKYHNRLPETIKPYFAQNIWDQTICSVFKNMMYGYARASFI